MIEFRAVGDIMLSANRGTGLMIQKNGHDYLFEEIRSTLNNANLLFGNLECPISNRGIKGSSKNPNKTFRANPECVKGLKNARKGLSSIVWEILFLINRIQIQENPLSLCAN